MERLCAGPVTLPHLNAVHVVSLVSHRAFGGRDGLRILRQHLNTMIAASMYDVPGSGSWLAAMLSRQ